MYTIIHETDPATSVDYSSWGRFIPGISNQLLTVGVKTLRIYRINPYATYVNSKNEALERRTKLECLHREDLMAPIKSIAFARLPSSPDLDSIFLTFEEAKLSVITFCPLTHQFICSSLHEFEDDFLRDGFTSIGRDPIIRTDPNNRCAAMLVYGRHLAIIPFDGPQAMVSYTIPLRSIDPHLDNIVDMQFLHGYYEPTLLFVFEPIQTTAGRASIRYDTVCILGVSFNTKDRVHAVVWNLIGLPSSIYQCIPLLPPIGGVCLFGANEIVYLNQSVPPCGISLNSDADEFTRFPLVNRKNLHLTLDAAAADLCRNNSEFLIGTKDGELYQLTMEVDISNVVKSMELNKTLDVSPPFTLTICDDNFVFLGSRLCDSQLLHYDKVPVFEYSSEGDSHKENEVDNAVNCGENIDVYIIRNGDGEPPSKRPTLNPDDEDDDFLYSGGDNGSTAVAPQILNSNGVNGKVDDEDELLYGGAFDEAVAKEYQHEVKKLCMEFEEVDRLLNVAPCKVLRVAGATDLSAQFRESERDCYFDLVSASGHGKFSSLCFFHRTIRPIVLTTSFVDGALALFSVGVRENGSKRYLVISRDASTVVLEMNENDMETLEMPLFATTETTVAAGDLAGGAVAVQVTAMKVILVGPSMLGDGSDEQLAVVKVDSNFPVQSASIVDPFVLLVTQNGRPILYKYKGNADLELINTDNLEESQSLVTAASIYKDLSGLMRIATRDHIQPTEVDSETEVKQELSVSTGARIPEAMESDVADIDDIDALLYGEKDEAGDVKNEAITKTVQPDNSANTDENLIGNNASQPVEFSQCQSVDPELITPTYWMLLARENGNLYIYDLQTMQLAYFVRRFNNLPSIVIHEKYGAERIMEWDDNLDPSEKQAETAVQAQEGSGDAGVGIKPEDIIMEVRIDGVGHSQQRPVLSIVVDDSAVFYELYASPEEHRGSLAMRMRRLNLFVATRSTKYFHDNGRANVEAAREAERHRPYVTFCDRVGNLTNSLFVGGAYPSLLVSAHGEFILHPMTISGPVASFCSFNNSNCPHGFIYISSQTNSMVIARLNPDVHYDQSYPMRRVFFERDIHHLVYMLHWDVFAMITSEPEANRKVCMVLNEDKHMEEYERQEDTFILPTLNRYRLNLFSTEDWKFVPKSDIIFEEFETVTCCEEVLLSSESTVWGMQGFLAVGTAVNYGEEVFVRGRILIYEMIEVVPEEGLPTTRHRLKQLYDKEQKGPVTSMCHCNGYLLTGMGQKIFIWQFRDGMLNGVSFLDMHFYIHSLVGFRSLALACDMFRSVSLVRYQEDYKALSLVSRDLREDVPSPMVAQFILDNAQLAFVVSDEIGNITVMNYMPESIESFGGERLTVRAAMNIGSPANGMIRINGHTAHHFIHESVEQTRETHNCVFSTLDGSWGVVRPISEKVFRRLRLLQQLMVSQVPQTAGLNPRGARFAKPQRLQHQYVTANRNLIDGNFIFQFLRLSQSERAELARNAGSNRYQIMDDILEFQRATTHF